MYFVSLCRVKVFDYAERVLWRNASSLTYNPKQAHRNHTHYCLWKWVVAPVSALGWDGASEIHTIFGQRHMGDDSLSHRLSCCPPLAQMSNERNSPMNVLEGLTQIRAEMDKHVIGHDDVKEALLLGLIAREHIYLEGTPGAAKTMLAKIMSEVAALKFFSTSSVKARVLLS
jgi:hypothetical protein